MERRRPYSDLCAKPILRVCACSRPVRTGPGQASREIESFPGARGTRGSGWGGWTPVVARPAPTSACAVMLSGEDYDHPSILRCQELIALGHDATRFWSETRKRPNPLRHSAQLQRLGAGDSDYLLALAIEALAMSGSTLGLLDPGQLDLPSSSTSSSCRND